MYVGKQRGGDEGNRTKTENEKMLHKKNPGMYGMVTSM